MALQNKGTPAKPEAPKATKPAAAYQDFGIAAGKHPAAIEGSELKKAADKCASDGSSDSAKALAEIVVAEPSIVRQAAQSGGTCELYNTASAVLK